MIEPEGDFRIVGTEPDGVLIFEAENGVRYESGETLEDFGPANLTISDSIADIAAEEGVTEAQLRQALRESHPDASVAEVMLRAREMER
jgi:hypothetical protein